MIYEMNKKQNVIEQFIFDPELGVVKREIQFSIVNYLCVTCSLLIDLVDLHNEEEV